ncbi:hypothetical protein CVD28_18900 [Bacillus sp. M6-12]|uniref:sensor histidine kinase n=1 Tax=Bacillus sp. M6-12 TaxID=2054166 RepID=UPI000C78434E|nr:sensor histidine kinase [Bacillus sp. M6-12]PLS16110.1 hypothetical protein CVD28_18900 [Bacillus sp. M6-12]
MAKRSWNWQDTLLFCVRTLWVIFNGGSFLVLFSNASTKLLILIWFILLYIVPYLFYRPGYKKLHYYLAAETLLTGGMYLFMMNQFHLPAINGFICFPLITIAYVCQIRPLIWVGPFIAVSIFTMGIISAGKDYSESSLNFILILAVFYGLGFSLGRVTVINNKRHELIESIQEKNATLEQYSKRIEELTIIEERNRVSQNLHDTVGDIFTSMITNLDALPYLLDANKDAEVEKSIKEISALTRKGLNDVRNTIHQLSPNDEVKTLADSFHEIIEEFMNHTDTEVELFIEGNEREVGQRIKLTLIRCLQESLTNAKRHGHASQVRIKIFFNRDYLILHIKDNGIGSSTITPGFGLHTMKDRVAALRGTLKIESNEGKGTQVICTIPLGREEAISI